MKIKLTLSALFIIFQISISFCQTKSEANYVLGEVMVQLNNKRDLPELLNNYNLTTKQIVSDRFNIYVLKFDSKQLSNSSIINLLRNEKSIINVQNNHNISLRETKETIPNDEYFNDQWSLLNTGQTAGTLGADIDATSAWDITTGGITALGDTIVVAIIDGGSYLNHEDLDFWKNRNEIPNNDIDDDNNGYIDDYDGWNAYNHNGTIPNSSHGVHVSGIAGAIGNNNIGIAGVSWNVKTLPIAGSSTQESVVVEALSYVYVVREKYDQTNGEEGAFIVADNCSFGVDNGQPENFPIWEAMYDSLGQLGILSMGATANRNWNIDSVGDIPTAFTTDFMISVTNTTKNDELFGSAGYGRTTIDLGAPGTIIQSLGLNNTYRTSSGTSMATPHVTGAAALLMAAADSTFITNYKNNPAQGALLVKDYLLNGVDQLPELDTITVSGGRLNLYNSINLMTNQPNLITNVDSVSLEIPINTIKSDTLIIKNSGSDTLFYFLAIVDHPDWLTISQNEGALTENEADSIILQFNTYDIDTGTYSCILNIDGADIENKHIPIKMFVYDDVGIHNTSKTTVKVFPNPTKASVEFSFRAAEAGEAIIEVFNQFGNIVYSQKQTSINNIVKFNWNSTLNPSGIYYYHLIIDEKLMSSGKVVKM